MCMSIRKSNMPNFSIKTVLVNDEGITGPMIPVWKVLRKDNLFYGVNKFYSPFLGDLEWAIGWNESNRGEYIGIELLDSEKRSELVKYGIHCYLRKKDAMDVVDMDNEYVVVKMYVYPSDVVAKGSTFRSHTLLLNGDAVHSFQDGKDFYSASCFDGLREFPTIVAMRVYCRQKDYLRGLYTDDELVKLLANYQLKCDKSASNIKPISNRNDYNINNQGKPLW